MIIETKKYRLVILLLLLSAVVNAQVMDSAVRVIQNKNQTQFSAPLRNLVQIPGAPLPFYTYFWDFGDGHFSTEKSPVHHYQKNGEYDYFFYAVNNYDDGKKPTIKKGKVNIQNVAASQGLAISTSEKDFFKANGVFEMSYNCMAMPNDTMLLTLGWKNNEAIATGGRFYLMLNEKMYAQNCFDTSALRLYNVGNFDKNTFNPHQLFDIQTLKITESGSPASHFVYNYTSAEAASMAAQTLNSYKNIYSIDVNKIAANNARFSFVELHVTPDMIKDTNATLVLTGLYVADNGNAVMHKLNVPVVNSHDPNKMNLKGGPIAYRLLSKNKSFNYKVRFQNNGQGPARNISLDIALPKEFDINSIKVTDMQPYCRPCDSVASKTGCWEITKTAKGAKFSFKGIYLAGTNQKGVQDKDSTKGFMEFSVKAQKKLDKKPFSARTNIYFDNNDPIKTNYATGRFLPGISPFISVGFEKSFGSGQVSNGVVAGFGLAPLAPRLPYFQFEVYYKNGLKTLSDNIHFERKGVVVDESLKREFFYSGLDSSVSNTINQIKLVPFHFRQNIGKYFGVGVGVLTSMDIGGKTSIKEVYNTAVSTQNTVLSVTKEKEEKIKSFSNFQYQPFIDIQLGKVKLGPHIGCRYYVGLNKNSFGYFYVGWRL